MARGYQIAPGGSTRSNAQRRSPTRHSPQSTIAPAAIGLAICSIKCGFPNRSWPGLSRPSTVDAVKPKSRGWPIGQAASIGIGGHLATPPLPHHRAYGSVPRRFGGLSTRQLFHGDQTQTTEARFGEGAMQRFREAQPPRSLWAEDSRTGRPFGDLEPPELAIALTARLPLDPDNATQAPSDPAIQRW